MDSKATGKTVYEQHLRHFRREKQFDAEPRQQFIIDLEKQLQQWLAEGDKLIVALDANEDVRTGDIYDMFTRLGLVDTILEKHSEYSPPATYDRNRQRRPIDAIFASPELQIMRAGYGAVGNGCKSSHQYLWIDVNK